MLRTPERNIGTRAPSRSPAWRLVKAWDAEIVAGAYLGRMADLFAAQEPSFAPEATPPNGPLADRLRPQSLADVVGQEHLTGPEGAIGRMVAAGKLSSIILWGPPGTGKTTIARLLADAVGLRFVAISAVFSGVADLKKVFAEAKEYVRLGRKTLLFVDEIHRFNRAQQDGFLPTSRTAPSPWSAPPPRTPASSSTPPCSAVPRC
jgi:hypothetical protein